VNVGGLVPYVRLHSSRSFDGTTYSAQLTWLRIVWKASVLAPWRGHGLRLREWRPW
jgi:hypothetical protein